MDRLEEIRQRTEQLVRIANNPYCLGPAALLDGVKEIVPALLSEVDRLQARAEAAEARADAAVEDMTAVLKCDLDDICKYCKHIIECKGQNCDGYCSGAGDIDGNYPDWKWSCEDFNFGTCVKMENTPCNGCFENDCGGFEWRGKAGEGESDA